LTSFTIAGFAIGFFSSAAPRRCAASLDLF